MMGYGVDSGRKPGFEHAREDCMETLGMGIDDTSCNVLEKMMNKKLLQSQSQSQSPEESVMGETDFEVVRENSVAVSNSIKQGDKNSSMSSRDGHVCRFCGRVFSSGRALGGHVRVHGTSRSNGESSSSGIVISRGGRSSADNWMKKSKVPTSRSNGNSKWVRNGSIEEEGEEEEEDYGVLKSMNMDAEEEELSDLKMVSLYTLRRNPKRSRRLNDEEFSMDLSTKNSRACVECGKEFFSSKALFGHMRCHPEREWRGIQPPDDTDDDDNEDNINGHGIVFADPGAVSVSPLCWQSSEDLEEKEEEEEEEEAVSVSDEESDRESMKKSRKEAYEPFSRSLLTWSVTAKRSRRRPVGLIQTQLEEDAGKEDVDNNNPEELEGDNEAARFLVMLASIADKANTNSNKVNRPVERQLTEESVYHSRKRKYEYQESMTETRGKYKCNTCKKLFNSHQALGGHRASHRKVKGCFAITYVNEEVEEVTEEEITEDGSSQLMVEYDMCSSHEREEDKRATNMSNLGHEKKMELAIPMKKAKGHECSICHKVFPSGQALGGHKRCHWSGERVPEPANSVISTEEQPKQRDTKKEPLFDLNEPAPVDEEDFEDAYGMMEVVPAFAKRIKMLEAVSNDGFRYVECNICGYKFTSMDELRTHQIAHALMPAS